MMQAAYCGAISDTEIDLLPDAHDKTLNLPPAISFFFCKASRVVARVSRREKLSFGINGL